MSRYLLNDAQEDIAAAIVFDKARSRLCQLFDGSMTSAYNRRQVVPPLVGGFQEFANSIGAYSENSKVVISRKTFSPRRAPRISRAAAIGCRISPIANGRD